MRLLRRECWTLPGWCSELNAADPADCSVYIGRNMLAADRFYQCMASSDANGVIRPLLFNLERRIVSSVMCYDGVSILTRSKVLIDGIRH